MEINVKSGYLLVSKTDSQLYNLHESYSCGIIEVGSLQDKGATVFFKEYAPFIENYLLVKVDDVVAWVKPEVKEEISEVVSA